MDTTHNPPFSALPTSADIEHNLQQVRTSIADALTRAGRKADSAKLVAVSKTRTWQEMWTAWCHGQRHFAENRVQEATEKCEHLLRHIQETKQANTPAELEPCFHLVGHLQSNKARDASRCFDWIHSLDSLALANRLQKWANENQSTIKVLLQVNWSGEHTKAGIVDVGLLQQVALHVVEHCNRIELCGLMSIASPVWSEMETRAHFAAVREMQHTLQSVVGNGASLTELSMGMSADFEWALMEGSTMVRIGTAIFGARQ